METVCYTTEFYVGHVFQIEYLAGGEGADYNVAEFFRSNQTAFVAHDVLERLVALLAERSGSGFEVLRCQCCRYIGWHEAVLSHHIGLEPYTHRVVGAEAHYVAHAGYTLQLWDYVDLHVVVEEFLAVVAADVREGDTTEHRGLTLLSYHAHLVYFGGEQVGGFGHTVLYVHGGHVGVESLFEIYVDGSRAGIGGGRLHVGHAFGTVNRLFERRNHGVEHSLSVCAVIGGAYRDGRRCDVGVLGDRQRREADDTKQHDEDGYHRRKHRSVNKIIEFHLY